MLYLKSFKKDTPIMGVERVGRRERRSRLEIFFAVLYSIQQESIGGVAKPTRVQFSSNTSYDKLSNYLDELEKKGMITKNPLVLLEKGAQFLRDYGKIKELVEELGLQYL